MFYNRDASTSKIQSTKREQNTLIINRVNFRKGMGRGGRQSNHASRKRRGEGQWNHAPGKSEVVRIETITPSKVWKKY